MTKQELMETYTAEQLAEMVVNLQNGKEKLTMNISDFQKCQEEYEKFLKESPLENMINKISKDILEQKNNAMAMEFTRIICDLLKQNGVYVHCTETKLSEKITKNSIEEKYGIMFDSMDFSEHDKEFTEEIERLRCELKDLEIQIEEEYKPLEIEVENLRKNERELSEENAELHCELQAVNAFQEGYPTEPIKVAEMLINATYTREKGNIEKAFYKAFWNNSDITIENIYSVPELRQIAEHLLVYCNHNEEFEE